MSVPLPSTVGWACSWCGGRVSGITGRRGRCSVWWTSRPLNTSLEPSCTSQTPWSKQVRHQGIKHTARGKKSTQHAGFNFFWGGGRRWILTVRGSLSLALGLSDGTPILRHWNTHIQNQSHTGFLVHLQRRSFELLVYFPPVYKAILSVSSLIWERDLEGAGHRHPVT